MNAAINTDRELYALKPLEKRYERAVTKARGLSVLVFPNGCKTFVLRYVAACGARRRLSLGDYPGVSLADARLKSAALRAEVAAGRDPAQERTAARAEARFGETISELAARYWKAAAIGIHGGRRRPLRPQTLERQRQLYTRYVQPKLGKRRFKEIRRADVRSFMNGFVLEGRLSPSSIAAIGDVLRALFAYALSEDLIEANPTAGLTRPVTPESRTRRFTEASMQAILAALQEASSSRDPASGRADPAARLDAMTALCLRFLILTLTRRGEAAGAQWAEIDRQARTWTIPGERTKNRQPHVVTLSPQALSVLDEVRWLPGVTGEGYVFASHSSACGHVDAHSLTRAVNRLCKRLALPPGSPHDFRRTAATLLTGERFRVRRFIVGLVLGHSAQEGAAVTAVYDRNEYLPEKRAALNAWGAYVQQLAPREDPAEREAAPPPVADRHKARAGANARRGPSAEVIDLFGPRQ